MSLPVFVDLGRKSEGMLDLDQVMNSEGELIVKVGDSIEARVVDTGAKTGCVVLRRGMSKGSDARDELGQAFEHGIPVEGVVLDVNKGGVEVQIAGLRAFCPVSQLDIKFVDAPENCRRPAPEFSYYPVRTGARLERKPLWCPAVRYSKKRPTSWPKRPAFA